MDQETVRDIRQRLARIEEKQDTLIVLNTSVRWIKRHVWAQWAALLSILGVKGLH